MRRTQAATIFLAFGAFAPGFAQQPQDVPQISSPSASSVVVDPVMQPGAGPSPAQVSDRSQSLAGEPQLTSDRASRQAPAQVARTERNAQPPQPLSRPGEGRTAAVEKVQGTDRCDPALPPASRSPACAQVIETRAGEFARPDPTELSPEQKLLLQEEREAAGDDVADATKRLSTSGEASDSLTAMGIASIVLDQQRQQGRDDKPEDPEAEVATQAIISFLSLTPPQ